MTNYNPKLHRLKKRFLTETEILFSLSEITGVVKIVDSFEENNTIYIVMEEIYGRTLKQLADSGQIKNDIFVVELLLKILRILLPIHKLGIVHNDLSPGNILITKENEPVIIDWGNSFKIGETSTKEDIIWTPGFTALENYSPVLAQDERCDIYSVACIGYYLLVGETPPDVLDRYGFDMIRFPDNVPAFLKNVLQQGLSLDVSKRYKNVEEFSSALTAIIGQD